MEDLRRVKSALISVFDKSGLDKVVNVLRNFNVRIYSTGGTFDYISKLGAEVTSIETLTSYPSILGGRVKTLHPLVFGGILGRRELESDRMEMQEYNIPEIDLVIVDLYPFEKTVAASDIEQEIIEKIDIGGISLIRAAAKNFKDVIIVPSIDLYKELIDVLNKNSGGSLLAERKYFAAQAFNVSSHYDTAIFNYFNRQAAIPVFKQSICESNTLRYGENPHQEGFFFGDLSKNFDQLHGKEISYNNLNDLSAGIDLIREFTEPTVAILKHNNACGLASRNELLEAWKDALAGDPVSAYGGVIVTNGNVDAATAEEMNKLFFEIILAPEYDDDALQILKSKKNRIILKGKSIAPPAYQFKSSLNGVLVQQLDAKTESSLDLNFVTNRKSDEHEISDLLFANKIVKHTKSNAIVLAKNKQLLASGVGQTSRVDALKQAIEKAGTFNFDLAGSVMASDAFFPFADSVEIAHKAGVTAVIQPGGSIRDKDSIDYCNANNVAMAITGFRHFKH
ncbi:MAG: bifunctional phosphoribosylaminoimidazolecarboxamide formyltransferase/IMP cyclohydrolase [Bacteroidales bacterium]|nr:bifunctional phosphoribosylaminoimidazolecarboxamide formyltransferase/IMP cyclohydrolase [Bacteroidales bacterium]